MYLNFYVQKGLLLKRIRDWDVRLGLTAITIALVIGTSAMAKIRTWNYRVFYYLHVVLSLSLLPVLYLHVSHLRIYILEAGAVYVLNNVSRESSRATADATIELLPQTNLLSIKTPLTDILSSKTYTPGQHVYLGFPTLPPKLRINPFSIANPHPTSDNRIHLIARTLSGTTAKLSHLAKQPQPVPLTIEGPYGSARHFPKLDTYDRILLVAGGVGATFTLPIYIDLLQRATPGKRVPPVRFIWTVRDGYDAQWGIDQLRAQLGKLPELELYVSRTEAEMQDGVMRREEADQTIELRQQEQSQDRTKGVDADLENVAKEGRPDLKTIVDEIFQVNANERVAVLVCGPTGMGKSLRREVGRWVARGRDVFWHTEEFGW